MHHKIGWGEHQEWWVWDDFEGRSNTETLRRGAVDACPEGEGPSRILRQSDSSMRPVNFTCQWVRLKSKLQHTGTWLATVWQPHSLRYFIVVFSHHLQVTGLLLPWGKIWHTFKRCYYFSLLLLFYNCMSLKLCNLKLRECLYSISWK